MSDQKVEMIVVFRPVETGGDAIRADGQHLKLIAKIVGGRVLWLAEDFVIEKSMLTEQEAKKHYGN